MNGPDFKYLTIGKKRFHLPFELELVSADKRLKCRKILRYIPGRRAVVLGSLDDKKVVAKLFFKKFRSKANIGKEVYGAKILEDAGIFSPKILCNEFNNEIKAYVLILEYIDFTSDISIVTEKSRTEDSNKEILNRFIKMIALLHNKGAIHTDLHAKNFLLQEKKIFFLDCAAIKKRSARSLPIKEGLKNLSVFFAQTDFAGQKELDEPLGVYLKARNIRPYKDASADFERDISRSRKKNIKKYLKKIYRNSTKTFCRKSFFSFMACNKAYASNRFKALLENPDTAFENAGENLLKAGNSATVVLCEIDGRKFVIKRYNMKNFFHAFRRAFKRTRADISWRSAHMLVKNDIRTGLPAAFKEKRFGPFRNTAFFICEYVSGENARTLFPKMAQADLESMAEKITALFEKFERMKISHGDMKATNIIIHGEQPYLIDLDSMQQHRSAAGFKKAFKKDVKRFLQNWEGHPEVMRHFKGLSQKGR